MGKGKTVQSDIFKRLGLVMSLDCVAPMSHLFFDELCMVRSN